MSQERITEIPITSTEAKDTDLYEVVDTTDLAGGANGTTKKQAGSLFKARVAKRPLVETTTGYTILPTDMFKVLRVSGAGPTTALTFGPAATSALLGNGVSITLTAGDYPLAIEPAVGDNIEGVPVGDAFCIPAHSSVTLAPDGVLTLRIVADASQRLSKVVSHLAQAINFNFQGLFTYAQVSATGPAVKGIMQVVGGYQNDRFIAGDTARFKNVGATNAVEITTNTEATIVSIAPNETYDITCLTAPITPAGPGTWEAIKINPDVTSNKRVAWGASDLSNAGTDGAGYASFPGAPALAVSFPPSISKAVRATFVLPPDYIGTGPQIVKLRFGGDTTEVTKNTVLQVQYHVLRPDNTNFLGGVTGTLLNTEVVPATALEVVTGSDYALLISGSQAGDELHFQFARIGTDGADDYLGNILVSSITYDYS